MNNLHAKYVSPSLYVASVLSVLITIVMFLIKFPLFSHPTQIPNGNLGRPYPTNNLTIGIPSRPQCDEFTTNHNSVHQWRDEGVNEYQRYLMLMPRR